MSLKHIWLVILFAFFQTVYSVQRKEIIKIDSLNMVAIDYFKHYDMANAMSLAVDALELSRSNEDHYGCALANYTLGQVFINLDEQEKAKTYFLETVKLSSLIKENYLAAMANIQMAEILVSENKEVKSAINYFEIAYDFAANPEVIDSLNKDKRNEVLFLVHIGLAKCQLKINEVQKAFLNIDEAKRYLSGSNLNSYNQGYYNFIYGKYYHTLKLYASATEKFYQARESLIKSKENKASAKSLLTEVYKTYASSLSGLGEDNMAYIILKEYSELQENIISEERIKYENIAKTKLEISNYKREAELAKKEQFIQADLKDKARRLNYITVLASVFLLGASLFFYKSFISKRKLAKVLKSRNKQLMYSREKALRSSKLKSEFISNVSHELRTPMYGVVGLTSMLSSSMDLNSKDHHILSSLNFTSDYLLKLINDILQISKIEADEIKIVEEPNNIRILFQNISESFKQSLKERNIKLICQIDNKLPKFVSLDGIRISQILMNLLGNSVKFTKNGNIHLTLEVLAIHEDIYKLRFSVKDDGIGIPKHKHKDIFKKFSQITDKNDEFNQGTGLGLSISNKIANLMGSEIKLDSEPGLGSEFSFELSCKEATRLKENVIASPKSQQAIRPIQGTIRILVAEDNKVNQMVTKNMLEKENFECKIVENGLLALEEFKANMYDLILMDINMPVLNGLDATQEIRKINKNVPIFALTAADIEEIQNKANSIGFNDIVIKPFDKKILFRKIYTAVSSYKVIQNEQRLERVI